MLRPWPAQSPDLSVIENVWEILKEKIFHRKLRTLDEFWEVAVEEWNNISREQISFLYDSIPRRLNTVLMSRGGHTHRGENEFENFYDSDPESESSLEGGNG